MIALPAARAAAAALGLAAAASLSAQTFRVGPTVHVSRAGAERAHEEVILGAHPTDPRRLLGCSIVDRDRYAAGGMHGQERMTACSMPDCSSYGLIAGENVAREPKA